MKSVDKKSLFWKAVAVVAGCMASVCHHWGLFVISGFSLCNSFAWYPFDCWGLNNNPQSLSCNSLWADTQAFIAIFHRLPADGMEEPSQFLFSWGLGCGKKGYYLSVKTLNTSEMDTINKYLYSLWLEIFFCKSGVMGGRSIVKVSFNCFSVYLIGHVDTAQFLQQN